jgi:hypothetical protein
VHTVVAVGQSEWPDACAVSVAPTALGYRWCSFAAWSKKQQLNETFHITLEGAPFVLAPTQCPQCRFLMPAGSHG